jgi:hypothetical protein
VAPERAARGRVYRLAHRPGGPAGRRAREVYGAEDIHDFARRAILDALGPGPGDHVLEVGCGGRRVLRPGAPVAIYTTGPELRGTPAAPEPLASLGHFHPDAELAALASQAGLHDARVRNDGGGQLLTARA